MVEQNTRNLNYQIYFIYLIILYNLWKQIGGEPIPLDMLTVNFNIEDKERTKDYQGMFQHSRKIIRKDHEGASSNIRYCLTRGCIKAAADLIRNVDETVDPCMNFYKFACGSFVKKTVIPEHQTSTGNWDNLDKKVYERLLKLFEGKSNHLEPIIFNSVRNFYKSCKNEKHIEKHSKYELKDILAALGGWPVVEGDKWIGNEFQWYILEQKSVKVGFILDRLLPMSIRYSKDGINNIIEFEQPELGLSMEYLIKGAKEKHVQAYFQYMVDTAIWLGASPEVAVKDMKDVLDFEIVLAKNMLARDEKLNGSTLHNTISIQQLSKIYPTIPWINHINAILDNPKVTIDADEIVNIAEPKYVLEFQKIILTIPARVQANYMIWRNAMFSMSYLNSKAISINIKFWKILTGQVTKSPRWLKCVMSIDKESLYEELGSLSNAVGSMFVKKYFAGPAKGMADNMVANIIKEFKEILDELVWMDPQTKSSAHKKADLITPHVAYPKEILNNKLLDDYYKGLVLNKVGYLNNILTLRKFMHSCSVKEFRVPISKQSWKTHGGAAHVNAYYNKEENSVEFPAAILDGIFFGTARPLYMNYGAMGGTIGHEIIHGFDDEGSQRDGYGRLVDWWKPKTKNKYQEKIQCVIDHYNNYTVDIDGKMLNLSSINFLGENIADIAGLKIAYRAYKKLVERTGYEPLLPSLKYSQLQLFWLSSAQPSCTVYRPASMKNMVISGDHLPEEFRVIGTCANIPEFAHDWGCHKGSKMNPTKQCTIW